MVSVSDVEVGVEVICHSTFRSRYPFKKRIHVKIQFSNFLNTPYQSPKWVWTLLPTNILFSVYTFYSIFLSFSTYILFGLLKFHNLILEVPKYLVSTIVIVMENGVLLPYQNKSMRQF